MKCIYELSTFLSLFSGHRYVHLCIFILKFFNTQAPIFYDYYQQTEIVLLKYTQFYMYGTYDIYNI